jgi:hypothetical protein
VGCLGLGRDRPKLSQTSAQITLVYLCQCKRRAAVPRVKPITNRVGEVASFLAGHARCDRIASENRGVRLPGQYLAEPPFVVGLPGEFERLGKVLAGQLGVIGGCESAGGQRPCQQGRIVYVARKRQSMLGRTHAVRGAHRRIQHRFVGHCPRAYVGRHPGVLLDVVSEDRVEPRQPFPNTPPRVPQRLQ